MTLKEAATSERGARSFGPWAWTSDVAVDTRLGGTSRATFTCSRADGFHGVIADDAIADVLLAEHDLTRAAQRLIELALDEGGPDNVTVVLLRIGEQGRETSHDASQE